MTTQNRDIPSISVAESAGHIRSFYCILGHERYGVTELRALGVGPPMVAYADDMDSFVNLAMQQDRTSAHVYAGIQPRPPGMFEMAPNEWRIATGGRKANVAHASDIEFITALALDIDAARRQDHPASDDEVNRCLDLGRRILGLPGFTGASALALSGNGAYVLAPLVAMEVDGDVAAKFKAFEKHVIASVSPLPHGLRIDPMSDLPRIIRVIGTFNGKGSHAEGRPHRRSCMLLEPIVPGGRSQFLTEQIAQTSASHALTLQAPDPTPASLLRGDLSEFELCEFVRWIEREAEAIPEPAWHEFLVQCAWLEGGDGLAHRLSSVDKVRYDRHQTQARLDRIRQTGYRPRQCHKLPFFTCSRFRSCPARRPIELATIRFAMEEDSNTGERTPQNPGG
jgi:hypothetical protein